VHHTIRGSSDPIRSDPYKRKTAFKARIHLLFFGIGTGTDQDFWHVGMRTTVLDDEIAIRLCPIPYHMFKHF